jgi:hypothetical protein
LDALCRQTGPDRVIFQRNRCPEDGHDAVPGELVDGAAVALDNCGAAVGDIRHNLAQPFRTDGSRKVHRADNIGEQHRDLLVLRANISVFDWGATSMAKPGVLQGFGATRAARCYGRHPTLRQSGPRVKPLKDSRLNTSRKAVGVPW